MEQRKILLLINQLTKKGKKHTAIHILQDTLQQLQIKTRQPGFLLIDKAITLSNPYLKLRSLKKRGLSMLKVIPLTAREQEQLSVKWLIDSARTAKGHNLSSKLAQQILLIIEGREEAVVIKRLRQFHRSAESSRY